MDINKCVEIDSWEFQNPEYYRLPKGQQQITIQFKLEVGGIFQVICIDFAYDRVLLGEKVDIRVL